MKKRIVVLLTIVGLLGLAVAAFAYTSNTSTATTAASCCKKQGDSCPMKGQGHDDNAAYAKASCCKKHEAEHSKAEGHSCDCCGDSCPMTKDASAGASSDGTSCCDDCACCTGKKDASRV